MYVLLLLNEAFRSKIEKNKLIIKKKKTKCMIFKRKGIPVNMKHLTLAGDEFDVVADYKYLGYYLQNNLTDMKDAEVRLNVFYAKSNWVLRNFSDVNTETLLFLFNAFCSPDYGLCLWDACSIFTRQIFKTFEDANLNILKKILGVSVSTSSHAVVDCYNKLLFKPHVLLNQARYFKRVNRVTNPALRMTLSFLKNGYLFNSMCAFLKHDFILDFASSSMDIIRARFE